MLSAFSSAERDGNRDQRQVRYSNGSRVRVRMSVAIQIDISDEPLRRAERAEGLAHGIQHPIFEFRENRQGK